MPKKFYPKKKAPAKKRVYKKKTVAKTSIKMMIKKALDRRIENKNTSVASSMNIFQSGAATITSTSAVDLTPNIGIGAAENGRVGNNVHMKNAYLRGFLRMNSTGTNGVNIYVPNQYHVRIFIGRLKESIAAPTTAQYGSLLRTGGSTFLFDSGSGMSLNRKVNTEFFTVWYDKIFKLGAGGHSTGLSQFSTLSGINNNDYKLNYNIRINLTKMIKKTLVFNDALSGNYPTNTSLFMWAGLVDSLASDTTYGSPPVVLDYDVEYSYEDA